MVSLKLLISRKSLVEPCHEQTSHVSTNKVRHNGAVRAQEMARGWKFWFKKVKELYYSFCENKGADQLCGYCEADLRLCFCICKMLVFS